MYKRLYTFLNNNNICNLQFGLNQQYSKFHALVNTTENIRKALGEGNIGCGVFVDLQNAFDIPDHQIVLAKLIHYGIRGVSNDWFIKTYQSNICIYKWIWIWFCCYKLCRLWRICFRIPLFLLYINDLK